MGKKKISKKLSPYSPVAAIQNKEFIAKSLLDCLITNDVDAFKEILHAQLVFANKVDFSKKSGIPKRTLFRMLSPEGNPTLENVSKIIHLLCA